MAITWTITNLDRQVSLNGKSDVVTAVHWRVTDAETVGSGDDEVSIGGKVYGVVGLDTSDLSSFTAYADLNEADALAWAKAGLGDEAVAVHERSVADQITEAKTPTQATGVPWND